MNVGREINGSPAYWIKRRKEIGAMVRQIGPPTFFLTLSAADNFWVDLLRLLKSTKDFAHCNNIR